MYEIQNKKFKDLFETLCMRHDRYSIFSDFVKMCAISIYNVFANNQEMENDYLRTINSYQKDEQELFTKMFGELILMYENAGEITDILGPLYEQEHLADNHLGQFFTPSHISDLLAKITIEDENSIKNIIKEKGFITLNEPTCGAGGMVLSFAKALKNRNINYQQNLLVEAADISNVCAYMTYIQLSLYGIPAVVFCRDTIAMKSRFKMETPLFFLQYYKFRKFYMDEKNKVERVKTEKKLQDNKQKITINKEIKNQNLLKEVTVKGNYQISLW